MQRISKLALCALFASAAVAGAARADGASSSSTTTTNTSTTTTNTSTTPASSTPLNTTGPAPLNRFAWAGIGYYGVHYNFCGEGPDSGFCVGATDGAFGIQVGAAMGFMDLMPGLHLDGWASIAPVFGSGTYFPINLGVGVTYDRLPVDLFGGLGFSIVPNSPQSVAVGLDINLMAIYPLPQVAKNFGGMVQLQFDILDENLVIWNLVIGATYGF